MIGVSDPVAIAAGSFHTCVIFPDGTVDCWGDNGEGQLGIGSVDISPSPTATIGVGNVTSIGAGRSHTCAVIADGNIVCWGNNQYGQIGNGTVGESSPPAVVSK